MRTSIHLYEDDKVGVHLNNVSPDANNHFIVIDVGNNTTIYLAGYGQSHIDCARQLADDLLTAVSKIEVAIQKQNITAQLESDNSANIVATDATTEN